VEATRIPVAPLKCFCTTAPICCSARAAPATSAPVAAAQQSARRKHARMGLAPSQPMSFPARAGGQAKLCQIAALILRKCASGHPTFCAVVRSCRCPSGGGVLALWDALGKRTAGEAYARQSASARGKGRIPLAAVAQQEAPGGFILPDGAVQRGDAAGG